MTRAPVSVADPELADFLDEVPWSPANRANARCNLARAERWLAAEGVAPLEATHRHLRGYLAAREASGVGGSTRHKEWQHLQAFYAWAARPVVEGGAGILDTNPALRVGAPEVPKAPRVRVAEASDVAALLDYFARTARLRRGGGERERALRNSAMVSLMFRSGCRVGELPWIDVADLARDRAGELVAVRVGGDDGTHTKAGKGRLVPLVDETPRVLERYLRARGDTPGPLFLGREAHTADLGRRLTVRAIRDVVERGARAAGVTVSSHDLRRGWTVESHRRGVDAVSLRLVGGWTSDDMIVRYLGPDAQAHAVEAFRATVEGSRMGSPRSYADAG